MKQKGQMSFDMYFAIIFIMLISGQLFDFGGTFGHSTDKVTILNQYAVSSNYISIQAQEKTIANNIFALAGSAIAFSEYNDFAIDYLVPKINDATAQSPQECDIEVAAIGGNNFEIRIFYPNSGASEIATIMKGQIMNPLTINATIAPPYNFKCGEKISIKKG